MWIEELLDPDHDQSTFGAILDKCGPLTFLIFTRCLHLSTTCYELRELRVMFLTALKCLEESRKTQLLELRRVQSEAR